MGGMEISQNLRRKMAAALTPAHSDVSAEHDQNSTVCIDAQKGEGAYFRYVVFMQKKGEMVHFAASIAGCMFSAGAKQKLLVNSNAKIESTEGMGMLRRSGVE